MRRIVYPLVAAALVASPAIGWAQTPGSGERPDAGPWRRGAGPAAAILHYRTELGLSSDQVARLEEIEARYAERVRPVRERLAAEMPAFRRGNAVARRDLTPEERAEMRKRREELRERMNSMTPEEREAMREQMRQRREEFRERLGNMTPEEREQMRQRMRERMREAAPERVRRREALRPVMEELHQIRRESAAEARDVLTQEQRDRLQQIRAERRAEFGRDRGERARRHPGPSGQQP